jgi:hypothetical protein
MEASGTHQAPSAPERRSTDLALARLHLRVGSLALARTEFETLAGSGTLDNSAQVDLAEARWRTGDIGRAGEAAVAALEHGVDAPIALMIAAEAAFALGRPGEARRLATRAMGAAGGTLDALFAGMPRSSVWPRDPAEPTPPATTLFGDDGPEHVAVPSEDGSDIRPAAPDPAVGAAIVHDGATPGLWDEDETPGSASAQPDAAALLAAGLTALGSGDGERAAVLLALTIRTSPHLSPAIIDATIDTHSPSLLLVRGDALRSTGAEAEAAVVYATAAKALGEEIRPAEREPTEPSDLAGGDLPELTGSDPSDPDAALQSGPPSISSNPQ